jgi:hypothetical protein
MQTEATDEGFVPKRTRRGHGLDVFFRRFQWAFSRAGSNEFQDLFGTGVDDRRRGNSWERRRSRPLLIILCIDIQMFDGPGSSSQ